MKTVAGQQPGLDVVRLVVVLAPVGGPVQPVAAAAFEIGDTGKFEFREVVAVVQRVVKVGIAAHGFDWRVFVDGGSP